jgi:DNA-binding NtrC family response regulator
MTNSSVMIIGTPSTVRDSFELAARRHVSDVTICEDGNLASTGLKDGQVRAVLITPGAHEQDVDLFLARLRIEHPHIPVFFVGALENSDAAHHWMKSGTVILPPEIPPAQLETILFPLADGKQLLAARRSASNTVVIERTEYPLDFARAKIVFETTFITKTLHRERGNVSKTARTIGMARRNLQIKIQSSGIDINRIRHEP